MDVIFDSRQLAHDPFQELHNGQLVAYAESPARAAGVLREVPPTRGASDFGLDPILAVHERGYIDFLRDAHGLWRAAGRGGDAIGYAFPVVGRRPVDVSRIDAKIGLHAFDASTPIMQATWDAAYWSAQTALTALAAIHDGESDCAFALCRPPGHHAGRDYMGGYCYLNNAAVAAARARALGLGPVAILDIDYHHGNGTQDIFLEDPDILFVSIHADPSTDFPYFWGHGDECGSGRGLGATRNFPLPQGTNLDSYRPVLAQALALIRDWGARFLIVSFGADTYVGDPIANFALATDDFRIIARDIAAGAMPTLIVMEGGYAIDDLGTNVGEFLRNFIPLG